MMGESCPGLVTHNGDDPLLFLCCVLQVCMYHLVLESDQEALDQALDSFQVTDDLSGWFKQK